MTKLSIAIAALAAVVSVGSLTHHMNPQNASTPSVPSTIQSDVPAPSCPPACALPTPNQLPD